MVDLGTAHGVRTVALLTDMTTPLGYAIGNAIEVTESIEVLAGGGPADVRELTITLAREMLDLAGLPDADPEAALTDGRAMDSWRAMIRAQDGDPDAPMPMAPEVETRTAPRPAATSTELDAYGMGVAAWRLGAGRARKPDPVSAPAGVLLHRRRGDAVRAGDVLYELRAEDPARMASAREAAAAAVRISASTAPDCAPAGDRTDRTVTSAQGASDRRMPARMRAGYARYAHPCTAIEVHDRARA